MTGRLTAQRTAWGAAAASLLVSGIHALLGPGFVLDDWFTLRNAHFSGAWAASGVDQQVARPGAAVVYAVVFGGVGQHPLAVLAIQAVLAAATAALLMVLFRSVLPDGIACVAVGLWVLLPNHLSLEVWASATNIALALLLVVAAGVLMVRADRWRWGAVPLAAMGALCYEAVIPVAAASVVVLPWLVRRRLDLRLVGGVGVALAAVAGWIVVHWHPAKNVTGSPSDLGQVVGAHLGWGIAPEGPIASLLTLAGLAGIVVACGRLLLPSLRAGAGPPEHAVAGGLVIVVLGTVPFAYYPYAPLGAGDRFNFVSAVGGALVWAGLAAMVWIWRRPVAVAATAGLALAGGVARVERSVVWHRAGADALAIQAEARRVVPDPGDAVIVIGPAPIQQANVAAYIDQSNIDSALQLAYDDETVRAGLTYTSEQFESVDPSHRVDIRPVSQLDADAVVEPG